jgi:hypothetical protein
VLLLATVSDLSPVAEHPGWIQSLRTMYLDAVERVARNCAKNDLMGAFHNAVKDDPTFRRMAWYLQTELAKEAEILAKKHKEMGWKLELAGLEPREGLELGLLEEDKSAELVAEAEDAALRLKIALGRVLLERKHLPPWGPPLIQGDEPVEEVHDWTIVASYTTGQDGLKSPTLALLPGPSQAGARSSDTGDGYVPPPLTRPGKATRADMPVPTAVSESATQAKVTPRSTSLGRLMARSDETVEQIMKPSNSVQQIAKPCNTLRRTTASGNTAPKPLRTGSTAQQITGSGNTSRHILASGSTVRPTRGRENKPGSTAAPQDQARKTPTSGSTSQPTAATGSTIRPTATPRTTAPMSWASRMAVQTGTPQLSAATSNGPRAHTPPSVVVPEKAAQPDIGLCTTASGSAGREDATLATTASIGTTQAGAFLVSAIREGNSSKGLAVRNKTQKARAESENSSSPRTPASNGGLPHTRNPTHSGAQASDHKSSDTERSRHRGAIETRKGATSLQNWEPF